MVCAQGLTLRQVHSVQTPGSYGPQHSRLPGLGTLGRYMLLLLAAYLNLHRPCCCGRNHGTLSPSPLSLDTGKTIAAGVGPENETTRPVVTSLCSRARQAGKMIQGIFYARFFPQEGQYGGVDSGPQCQNAPFRVP